MLEVHTDSEGVGCLAVVLIMPVLIVVGCIERCVKSFDKRPASVHKTPWEIGCCTDAKDEADTRLTDGKPASLGR